MKKNSKILVTGTTGLVGASILRILKDQNYRNLYYPTRKELDLLNEKKVKNYLEKTKPDYVFSPAAYVGGIEANMKDPINFISLNTKLQNNIILSCYDSGVNNFAFFGSSCIYPKYSKQPIKENELLNGKLELTNEAYAIAKISGLKLCSYIRKLSNKNYFTLMPSNLYGQNDNYDKNYSHVIPAILNKIKLAKKNNINEIKLYGTGKAKREFLYVDDLAKAAIIAMKKNVKYSMINVGSGEEITINKLAKLILRISDYRAKISFDSKVPDGTPRKLLNSDRIKSLGWKPKILLTEGIKKTYDFLEKDINIRL